MANTATAKRPRHIDWGRIIIYTILILGVFVAILPFFWMISTSLMTLGETINKKWLPDVPQFSNYVEAWTEANFAKYFLNSVIITAVTVLGQLTVSILAGYGFARIKFFGREVIFAILLASMMIPEDYKVLDIIPCRYALDGQPGIENPEGMAGNKLEASAYVLFTPRAHADSLDGSSSIGPWLYRVTANLCYNWLNRRRRWQLASEDMLRNLRGPRRESPEASFERQELRGAVEEALEGLSLNHRLVIMLFYMGDFNLEEIGYILDCPVGTVKSRLHYARLRLREVISEEEIRPLVEALQSVGGWRHGTRQPNNR